MLPQGKKERGKFKKVYMCSHKNPLFIQNIANFETVK